MRTIKKVKRFLIAFLAVLTSSALLINSSMIQSYGDDETSSENTEEVQSSTSINVNNEADDSAASDQAALPSSNIKGKESLSVNTKDSTSQNSQEAPGMASSESLKETTEILEYEGADPIASIEGKQGEKPDVSTLPEKIRVLVRLDNENLDFTEAVCTNIPDTYKPSNDYPSAFSVYEVQYGKAKGYRVYGTVNDKTDWFGFDPVNGKITGIVKELPVSFDTASIDINKTDPQTFNANVSGYTFKNSVPKAVITLVKQAKQEEQPDVKEEQTKEKETSAPISKIATASLAWLSGSSTSTIKNNQLTITPDENIKNGSNVAAQLVFTLGGDQIVPAGDIKIVLPLHILFDRDGKPADTISLPFVKAPEKSGTTSFNYSIDEANNEVIITNYEPVASSTTLSCQIGWSFTPSMIRDGYTNDKIQAQFTISDPEQSGSLEKTSDPLCLKVHTTIPTATPYKWVWKKLEKWQDAWGQEPADASDYFYVIYRLCTKMAPSTQPYRLTFKEKPDPNGKLVGWYASRNLNMTDFEAGTEEDLEKFIAYSCSPDEILKNDPWSNTLVVIAYNRDEVKKNKNKVKNTYTAVLSGIDGAITKKSATSSYTYTKVNFNYGGDQFGVTKSGDIVLDGAMNALNNGNEFTAPGRYYLGVSNRGWGMTDDGKKTYTTYLNDGELYLQNFRLQEGDYAITCFYPRSYTEFTYEISDEEGYVEKALSDYSKYDPIEVWIKKDGAWSQYGSYTPRNSWQYTFNGKLCSAYTPVNLPEGVTDISFRQTCKDYKVQFKVDLGYKLIGSSHVKELLKNQNYAVLYNIDSGYATNEAGKITSGSSVPSDSTTIKNQIIDNDKKEYGQVVAHAYARDLLYDVAPISSFKKIAGAPVANNKTGQASVDYTLVQYSFMSSFEKSLIDDAIATKRIDLYNDGIFYDLLPAGCSVDLSSIKAVTYGSEKECPFTLDLKENWRNSGQTMLMIHVQAPDGKQDFCWKDNLHCSSGFKVTFTLIDTYVNMMDYSRTIYNSAAYYSNDGNLSNGMPNDGGNLKTKEYFKNLTGLGDSDPFDKNVQYSDATTTFTNQVASESGFSKSVKAADGTSFENSAQAKAGGTYIYRLRFQNGPSQKSGNLCFYDVLDNAYADNEAHWKGSLESIDVSQLENKGLDVKIYYSTYTGFGNLESDAQQTALADTKLWSLTPPADLSKVTAIAIDFSKDKDGNPYFFKGNEVALAYITMKAPFSADSKDAYAYNRAYLHKSVKAAEDETLHDSTTACSRTQVSIKPLDITINKEADPASGTKENPAVVENGSKLTYTIEIQNKDELQAIENVKVQDVIPEGLMIDASRISYTYGTQSQEVDGSSEISFKQSGQKLDFDVNRIEGRQTLSISIPVTVDPYLAAGTKLVNQAKLISYDGTIQNLTSNKTYHVNEKAVIDFPAYKHWIDYENKYNTRPDSITVELLENGKETGKTLTLNEENGWQDTFKNLDEYDLKTKQKIEYAIQEVNVPAGYEAKYSENGQSVTDHLKTEIVETPFKINLLKTKEGTQKPVAGAVFAIGQESVLRADFENEDDPDYSPDFEQQITTNEKGQASFTLKMPDNQDEFYMMIGEIEAPAGYEKSDDLYTIAFQKDKTPKYTWNEKKQVLQIEYSWKASIPRNLIVMAEDSDIEYDDLPIDIYQDGLLSITNAYSASGSIQLEGLKSVNGATIKDKEFKFEVKDENGKVVSTGTNDASGKITFSKIEYDEKEAGTHTYTVSEVKGDQEGYTYDDTVYTVKVNVTDNGKGVMEAELANPNQKLNFSNIYTPAPITCTLKAKKNLVGQTLKDKQFSFELLNDKGDVLQRVSNDAKGNVAFNPIEYNKAGTYSYKIKEVKGSQGGINWDDSVQTVSVTVKEDNGILKASVTPQDPVTFTNTYSASGSIQFEGTKSVNGATLRDKEFEFEVKDENGKVVSTGTNDASGKITFSKIEYDETDAGIHTYTVSEVKGDQEGFAYDDTVYTVQVNVKDNGKGVMEAELADPDQKLNFSNTYTPVPITYALKAKKNLAGQNLTNGQFQFELLNDKGDVLQRVSNDEKGNVVFDPIEYSKAGTYSYKIKEVKGSQGGIDWDDSVKTVTVTVSEENGILKASVTSEDPVTFTNTYSASGSIQLEGLKSVNGAAIKDKEFKFEVKDENGKVVSTGTNDASGKITFSKIEYDEKDAGTHTYTVIEVKGDQKGFLYDDTVYTVKVIVTDNGQGVMETELADPDQKLEFSNIYRDKPDIAQIFAHKKVQGPYTLKADDFSFILSENGKILQTVKNQADGRIVFDPITYTKPGNHVYTVKEVQGNHGGFTYDKTSYKIQVHVQDQGNGTMKAEITYPKNNATFTNTYKPAPASITLSGTKKLTGRNLNKGDFTFTLRSKDKILQTVKNNADGSFAFEPLIFDKAGTYIYQIEEVKGNAGGVAYDDSVKTVTVDVTDNEKGKLEASVDSSSDDISFTNHYKAKPALATITGKKVLKGTSLKADAFTFELKDEKGNVIIKTQNKQDGTFSFDLPAFDKPGTYVYEVSEEKGQNPGTTYDDSMQKVTVTVKDNGQGALFADVKYPENGLVFTNHYKAKPVSVALMASKKLSGKALDKDMFHFVLKEKGQVLQTKTNDEKGNITFDSITFDKAGTYSFVIEEVSGKQGGITYDTKSYPVDVVVTDNEKGSLVYKLSYEKGPAIFINSYTAAPTSVSLKAKKILQGDKELESGEYAFELLQDRKVIQKVSNDKDGNIVFEPLHFDKAGTYLYQMKEIKGSEEGTTYDSSIKEIKIEVSDDGNGSLNAKVEAPDLTFTNSYKAKPASLILEANKTLKNKELNAGEFSFILKQEDKLVQKVSNAKDGKVLFDPLTFDKPGTYKFTLEEVKANEADIKYDSSVYNITITVKDNGSGKLEASLDDSDKITFTNVYEKPKVDQDNHQTKKKEKFEETKKVSKKTHSVDTAANEKLGFYLLVMIIVLIPLGYFIIKKH